MMRVVVIEDDADIIDVVTVAFEIAWPGSEVLNAPNGHDGLRLVQSADPDVLILDVGLPEGDAYGYELCKEIRGFSAIPVIMLTARDREVDVVRGLELGAADYITKPFSAVELIARTRAVLRRVQMSPMGAGREPYYSPELSVNFDTREVIVQSEPVKLTPIEYDLLCYLIRNQNQVVTTRGILSQVWGDASSPSNDLVKAHIQRLRKKLRDSTPNPRLIITERGRGYRFIGSA